MKCNVIAAQAQRGDGFASQPLNDEIRGDPTELVIPLRAGIQVVLETAALLTDGPGLRRDDDVAIAACHTL